MIPKKTLILLAMLFGAWPFLSGQQNADSIPEVKVREIITVLAGDSLRGRGNGSPDLLKAGLYIITQFKEAGLQPLPGFSGLFHSFLPFGGPDDNKRDQLHWNGQALRPNSFLYLAAAPGAYSSKQASDFETIRVDGFTADLLSRYDSIKHDLLIWTPASTQNPLALTDIKMPPGGVQNARLLVYAANAPDSLLLTANEAYYNSAEYNIVGILPGRSKPAECIIFSAHYDHEGVNGDGGKDRIMNGANDNASGTTALVMLARYYGLRGDNERTLVFCAFAGEELGLKGSWVLSAKLNPETIKAGVNLEMLGVPQFGRKKVFITGDRYSRLPGILSKELRLQGVKTIREPDENKGLFKRSDNYPFVTRGIAYHTIMASDDDDECYHKPCDEIKRIDIPNLTFLIRAIAGACRPLITGEIGGVR